MPAGTFDARIVAAGAGCDPPLGLDSRGVILSAGERSTLALEGRTTGSPSLRVVALGDDLNVSGGQVALRFLNADPAMDPVTLDVQALPSTLLEPAAFAALPPADAGLDPNGYAGVPPLSAVGLSITGADAGADGGAIATATVTAAGGAVITLVFVPTDGSDTDASPNGGPVLVECIDNAGTVGLFSNCSVLP